jgi:hypothetical protein
MTLIEFEVQTVRQSNEALSKRHRAKKTRLQDQGKMTVDEAREAIDQMDIDTQIQGELSRRSGRGRQARPEESHCGKCGKAGHNIRTCQTVAELSSEEDSN